MIPFEQLADEMDPNNYSIFVAVAYGQLNRLRTRLLSSALEKRALPQQAAFRSRAFVWKTFASANIASFLQGQYSSSHL